MIENTNNDIFNVRMGLSCRLLELEVKFDEISVKYGEISEKYSDAAIEVMFFRKTLELIEEYEECLKLEVNYGK